MFRQVAWMLAGISAGNYQAAADQLAQVGLGGIVGVENVAQPTVAAKKVRFEGASPATLVFTPEFRKAMASAVAEVCHLEEEDAERMVAEVEATVEWKPMMVALVQAAAPKSASDIPAWPKDLTDKKEGTTVVGKSYDMFAAY